MSDTKSRVKSIRRKNTVVFRRQDTLSAGTKSRNLFEEASKEAYQHKWIESEKSGHDLGDQAIEDWYKRFWNTFVRERWIQHIRGEIFWPELDNDDFSILLKDFAKSGPLVDEIVKRLEKGGENLDIVQWAIDSDLNLDTVIDILTRLNLNSHRLMSKLDPTGREFATRLRERHRPRALVVDDDSDVCLLLKALLEYEQFEVVTVTSGEEAMEVVQSRRFDLFILDLRMPKRHGAEIAYYLRRHGVYRFIVAIGASLEDWHECDLYDCGFTHLLKKPFPLEKISLIAREVIHGLSAV
ncbi:MAG: response regulator [Planctomycetota bacterium]|jgi:CheY-like chemotaxis protein|nr:response regulator [Planctomycetota bacterium]